MDCMFVWTDWTVGTQNGGYLSKGFGEISDRTAPYFEIEY
jgi:hypothetical protein